VAQGGEVLVNTTTGGDQYYPSVAGLADGGYVIAWHSQHDFAIHAQRYDASGVAQGREAQVSAAFGSQGTPPSIAALTNGGYVVTWNLFDGSAEGIGARRYDANGVALGGEFLVNTTIADDQFAPTITAIKDGFVITWTSANQDGSGYGVYAQRYLDAFQATEQVALSLKGSMSVADVDAGTSSVTATLSVGYGLLHLEAGTSGAIVSGNDSASATITGTLAQINALLGSDATSVVSFTANSDAPPVSTTLTLSVNDNGNSGSGGALSGNDSATIAIIGVNDTPVLANAIADRHSNEDTAFSYQVPANSFSDPDGDTLGYNATLANGDPLPSWLSFNAATRTFSGTPPHDFNGTLSLKVIASDGIVSTFDTFDLVIDPVNDAPTVLINAPALPLGSEVQVNTTVASGQQQPSLVTLSDGGYVIVWTDGRVFLQRYDASGVAVGGEVRVDPTGFVPGNGGIEPSVASLSGGGYVVTWWSNNGVNGQDVFAQRYDASGVAQGGATLVNTTTGDQQFYQSAAGLSGGSYVVTWMSLSQDGSGYGIYVQRFNASGVAQGGEVLVNTTTANDQLYPTVVGLVGGGYVIAWQSSNDFTIYSQRYNAAGVAQGGETQVGTPGTVGQFPPASIAALADGGYVVTWSAFSDGSSLGIYARRYDANGVALSGVTLVNTTTADEQTYPAVTAIQDGYVITWTSGSQDGSGYGVYAQRYSLSGMPVGGEFLVNTTTNDNQFIPAIAALPGGGFVITWQSNNQDGDSLGVYAQRFDENFHAVEQIALDLKGSIVVADVDAGSGTLTATISVGYGVLHFAAGTSGASIVSGNDSASVIVSGTLAQLNALLAGDATSVVAFTATTDTPPAATTLTVSVADGGNSGAGGTLTGGATETILIASVNDAPEGLDHSLALLFDEVYTFSVGDFSFTDAESNGLREVTIKTLPAAGTICLNNIAISVNDVISAADIAAGLLTYAPGAGAAVGGGYASFTYIVRDDGGTANGGADTDDDANTLTIDLVTDNHPPIVANPIPDRHSNEDAAVLFQVPANSFSDPDGDTLTYAARLANGDPLPDWLSFDAGTRTFSGTPPQDFNGTLSIRVTAADGSVSAYDDFDLIINPVNDAPVNNVGGAVSVNEDTTVALTGISIADDGAPGDTYTISLSVQHGTLTILTNVGGGITGANIVGGGNGTNGLTITGTLAQINATLAAAGGLTYQGDLNYNGSDGLRVSSWEGVPADAASFAAPLSSAALTNATSLVTGDLNGDGRLDLVYIGGGSVGVRFGNGDGTFGATTALPAGATPSEVVLADVDGDSDLDLVSTDYASGAASFGSVGVRLNNGSGTFGAYTSLAALQSPYDVVTGDVNGDGQLDIIVDRRDYGLVSVLLASGAPGSFAAPVTYNASTPNYTTGITLGDFNNDGRLDIIAFNQGLKAGGGTGTVTLLLNTGNGVFAAPVDIFSSGTVQPYEGTTCDLNNDGNLDLVFVNYTLTDGVTVMLGNGNGTFAAPTFYATSGDADEVRIGDVNGDGIADIVTSNGASGSVAVFLGNGNGTFQARVDLAIGSSYAETPTLGDFNGDGRLDIAVNGATSTGQRVLLNTGTYLGDSDTRAITVNPVNDAPSAQNGTVTLDEDGTYVFTVLDFPYSDPENNGFLAIRIATLPGAGTLLLNGAAVHAGDTITAAQIFAGQLSFTPGPNGNGAPYASFTFQLQDNGGTANGGVDLDPTPNTMSIAVNAVNDPPVTTAPAQISTNEVISVAVTGIQVSDIEAGPAGAQMTVLLIADRGTIHVDGTVPGGIGAGGIQANDTSTVSLTGTQAQLNAISAPPGAAAPRSTPKR
jgi:hypothetical protein